MDTNGRKWSDLMMVDAPTMKDEVREKVALRSL